MMNNKKFVFVLGAGASKDFGYPTGAELIKTIVGYKHDSLFIKFMEGYGISGRDIGIFSDRLEESGLNSIDAFLARVLAREEKQPIDFEKIGRAGITYAILSAEKASNRQRLVFNFDDNWHRHIFNFLDDDYKVLHNGRVRFITFNYDLALEYYIARTYYVRNYIHSATPKEQATYLEFLDKIKILHFYGSVGNLYTKDGRAYGAIDNLINFSKPHLFWEIAKNVEIIRPNASNGTQAIFTEAQQYLAAADYIFFLGFGFDSLNMERLGLHQVFQENIQDKLFYTTVYEADNSSIYDFENRVCPNEEIRKNIYTRGEKDEKIVSFLKNKCFILSQLKD